MNCGPVAQATIALRVPWMQGVTRCWMKDGKTITRYIYNICDHEACYKEVQSQAISYTTGVPAMIGALMFMKGLWKKPGVFNVEEFDPDPFMAELNRLGSPWVELHDVDLEL